ncbi:MAG: hypothetical protein NTZ17_16245 [Phycisphaerae bacterium]|nr:hypothetical protein [Phycisphaerae bacterium]
MSQLRISDCGGWHRQGRRPWRWLVVSRASGPRFEGGTPSTRRGQEGRDTTTPKQARSAAARRGLRVPPDHLRGCPGFSLLEAAVTMAVTSIIMLGIGSAMLLAGKALPDARSPAGATISAAEAAERILAELQYAVSVGQRSANMVDFTVADRNGDGTPETIRYEWSGTSGAPLTRRYNGGTLVDVLTDVREFSLSYALRTTTTEIPQGNNESAETSLASYSATESLDDYKIWSIGSYAEYFFPGLPANAVSWKVTRVVIFAHSYGATDGEARVQLQLPTTAHFPSGAILEEKVLLESTLTTSYLPQEFTFSGVSGLSPSQGLVIVVKWIANAVACYVNGRNTGVTPNNMAKSSDGGVTWSVVSGASLLFSVYGTVTTAGTPQIQSTYYLEGVEVKLRAGSDGQAVVQGGIKLLNRPEVIQ